MEQPMTSRPDLRGSPLPIGSFTEWSHTIAFRHFPRTNPISANEANLKNPMESSGFNQLVI